MSVAVADYLELVFEVEPDSSAVGFDTMRARHGLQCRFDLGGPMRSRAAAWSLGGVGVFRAELSDVTLMPLIPGGPSWVESHLYVKMVTAGYVDLEQAGQRQRFHAGSMLLVDPEIGFAESFSPGTEMTALQLPKARLRERGAATTLVRPHAVDLTLPDMWATRELLRCTANQSGAISPAMAERLGEQILALVAPLPGLAAGGRQQRSGQAVLFRAKAYIQRCLGDERLDTERIADAAHVSAKHLQRLFKEDGLSPMRYVWQARLAQAERLLSGPGARRLLVQEVAWQCGFASVAHFSRLFSQRYGVSPRDARAAAPPPLAQLSPGSHLS